MRVRTGHISLEFGDSDKQHTSDIEMIFDRAIDRRYAWITGTEAGPGSGNTGKELMRVAKEAGYRPWVPSQQSKAGGRHTDCWLAVRQDLIVGGWKTKFLPAIPGSSELYAKAKVEAEFPKWGPKGLVAVEFKSIPALGEINLGVAHHLTGGRDPERSVENKVDKYEWNEKLDEVITKWMREVGAGPALAFMNTDRNASDRSDQAIQAATSLADELKKWHNTGHGDIDWMMSFNKDGRVTAQNYVVLNDRQFHLNTDHFFCEGTFNVEALAA